MWLLKTSTPRVAHAPQSVSGLETSQAMGSPQQGVARTARTSSLPRAHGERSQNRAILLLRIHSQTHTCRVTSPRTLAIHHADQPLSQGQVRLRLPLHRSRFAARPPAFSSWNRTPQGRDAAILPALVRRGSLVRSSGCRFLEKCGSPEISGMSSSPSDQRACLCQSTDRASGSYSSWRLS